VAPRAGARTVRPEADEGGARKAARLGGLRITTGRAEAQKVLWQWSAIRPLAKGPRERQAPTLHAGVTCHPARHHLGSAARTCDLLQSCGRTAAPCRIHGKG